MARRSGPWRREGRGWYTHWQGRQVKLAGPDQTKAEAWQALDALRGDPEGRTGDLSFSALASLWLDCQAVRAQRGEIEAKTLRERHWRLRPAVAAFGTVPASSLKPHHVTSWFSRHPNWGDTNRRAHLLVVAAVTKWGKAQGHTSPLTTMRIYVHSKDSDQEMREAAQKVSR